MLRVKNNSISHGNSVKKESISVTTVFVIAGILFATLCFAIIFFRYSTLSPFHKFYTKLPPKVDLSNYLKDKSDKATPGEIVALQLTESQLSEAVCLSCETFPLKNPTLKITPDGIIVDGKTSKGFWGMKMEFILLPKIVLGRLNFEITEVKAAGVKAPVKLTDSFNPQINYLFSQVLSGDQQIVLTEARCMVGYLRLEGSKK